MFKKILSYIVITLILASSNLTFVLASELPENDPEYRKADTYLSDLCFTYTKLDSLKDLTVIRRIEAVDFLVNLISTCNKDNFKNYLTTELPYKDLENVSTEYLDSLKIAYGLGLLSNKEYFMPDRYINRIDLSKVSLKFYGLFASPLLLSESNEEGFSDLDSQDDKALASFVKKIGFPIKNEGKFNGVLGLSGKEFIIWMYKIDEFGRALISLKNLTGVTDPSSSDNESSDSTQLTDANIKEIVEIWNTIKKYLVSPTDKKIDYNALEEAILQGMFQQLHDSVDQYSYYVPKGDITFTTQEHIGGIGATLQINENNKVSIETIIPDTPAEKSGLKVLDEIVKVDDKVIEDMTTSEVASLIRGDEGTDVKITVYRPSAKKNFTFTITRAIITITYVDSEVNEYNGNNYLYTKILTFNLKDIINTYEEHLKKGINDYDIKGIIIDLRDNPGGYVSEVSQLIEVFLGKDKKVFSFEYKDGTRQDYVTESNNITDLPLVVLVNENSASASEIFAIAMQSYGRAAIIGVETYGKHVAQQIFSLDKTTKAEIRFTIAKWFGPKDELAPATPDEIIEDKEAQLKAGYKWLDGEL